MTGDESERVDDPATDGDENATCYLPATWYNYKKYFRLENPILPGSKNIHPRCLLCKKTRSTAVSTGSNLALHLQVKTVCFNNDSMQLYVSPAA
jgi:hypothetical protein